MNKQYRLYIIHHHNNDVSKLNNLSFNEVKELSDDFIEADYLNTLLQGLVMGLNSGEYVSDVSNFYIVDEDNGIILYK